MMDWMMSWGWLVMVLCGVFLVALIAIVIVLIAQLSRSFSR